MGRWFGTKNLIVAMVLADMLVAQSAPAQPEPTQFIDLKLDTDPSLRSCPTPSGFRELIVQQLGYDPHRTGAKLGVDVRLVPSESGIDGFVSWRLSSRHGVNNRRFTARREECREMLATISFVVAVQIQLMASEQANESPADSALASNAEPRKESSNQELAEVTSRSSPQPRLSLTRFELRQDSTPRERWAIASLGPSIGFGLAPSPVLLGRLTVAYRSGWLGLDASVEASLPVEADAGDAGGFRYWLLVGALGTCAWHIDFAACGVLRLGRNQANGIDVDRPAAPTGLIAEVGPRVAHIFRLADPLGLQVRLEGLYSIAPWTVELNQSAIWKLPRFAAVAGIDLTYRIR